MEPRDKVIQEAKKRKGTWFHRGQANQCSNFVRDVFATVGVPIGNAATPSDLAYLNPGDVLGPSYANSFAGTDVGDFIDWTRGLTQAGDIVMTHTLDDWHTNAITHVGIAVDEHHWVHRPTMSAPVKYGIIPWHQVRKVVRPHGYKTPDVDTDKSIRKLEYWEHLVTGSHHADGTHSHLSIDDDQHNKSLVSMDITPHAGMVLNINGRKRQVYSVKMEVKFRDI